MLSIYLSKMLYYFICRLIKEHSPYTLNDVIIAPLTVNINVIVVVNIPLIMTFMFKTKLDYK